MIFILLPFTITLYYRMIKPFFIDDTRGPWELIWHRFLDIANAYNLADRYILYVYGKKKGWLKHEKIGGQNTIRHYILWLMAWNRVLLKCAIFLEQISGISTIFRESTLFSPTFFVFFFFRNQIHADLMFAYFSNNYSEKKTSFYQKNV